MAESMSIQAILSAVDSGFSSTMKNAEQAVAGLGGVSDNATKQNGGFMSSVKTIASGIGVYKLASAGLNAISSGFGEVVGEMTESNIAWQTFDGNMSMLGKSPAQIAKVQSSLQDFATASIYGASDMATTYAQMAALGTENTEQLVKGMGGLAASAENPKQAMKTLSQQMVQALAKPQMQWQDFKLMMEQAPSAMAQVAKHMGMSLDELILGIQDGEIASKDFAQAVAEVGTNEHFTKLATTFKSTGQALDGMTETLANKLMPAFQALDKIGIKAVEGITDMIDKVDIEGMVESITRIGKVMAPAFKEVGRHIGKAMDQVKQFFEPVTKGFGEIGQAVKTFGSDMLLAISYVGLGQWDKAWDTLKSSATSTFKSITDSVGTMFSGLWQNIQSAWPKVLDTIASGWDIFKTGFSGALDWFNNIDWRATWDGLYNWASNALDNIGAMVAQIDWEVVVGEITGAVGDIVSAVKGWWEANKPVIDEVVKVLLDPQSEINQKAGEFHDQVNKLIGQAVASLALEVFDVDIKLSPQGNIDWDTILADIRASYPNWTLEDIMPPIAWGDGKGGKWKWDWNLGEVVEVDIKTNANVFVDEYRIQNMNMAQLQNEAEKLGLIQFDMDGNVMFNPDFTIPPDAGIDVQALANQIADTLGIPRVELKSELDIVLENIKMASNAGASYEDIRSMVEREYGNEYYEAHIETKLISQAQVMRDQGHSEASIQQAIDAIYGEGAYEATVQTMITAKATEMLLAGGTLEQVQAYLDEHFGEGTYESNVNAIAIAMMQGMKDTGATKAEIRDLIVGLFGEDVYNAVVDAIPEVSVKEPKRGSGFGTTLTNFIQSLMPDSVPADVNAQPNVKLVRSGFGGGAIGSAIGNFVQSLIPKSVPTNVNTEPNVKLIKGRGGGLDGEVESYVQSSMPDSVPADVNVQPNLILQSGHSAGDSILGSGLVPNLTTQIQGMFPQAGIPVDIKVAPNLTLGNIGGNDTGKQFAPGSKHFDISALTAQVTAQLSSLQTAVNTAMGNINSVILQQANLWGTTVSTAITTMSTNVTSGMTAMATAVLVSLTAMSIAVIASMTAMALAVSMAMATMASNVASAMEAMVQSVTSAMEAMVQAVTAGMESAVSAVEAGVDAIINAVSGLYDAMYSAGESAGQGLADGLNSQIGAVEAAASALASAANKAAQLVFDINSPSRVWRSFGYSDGEGLVQGLDGSRRAVEKSATRLAVAGLPSIAPFSSRNGRFNVSGNVTTTQQNADLKAELSEIKKAIKEGQVIMLDGNTWVGATVDRIDTALGNNQSLGGRHQLT